MSLDMFNLISGAITIIAFIFSIAIYIRDKAWRSNLESGLIGLIGNLDLLVFSSYDDEVTKNEINAMSAMIRNQTIALLKSFSDKEERFRTFDFGFSDEEITERIKKRKEVLGIDYKGCIVPDQAVLTPMKTQLVQDLKPGDVVLSYSLHKKSYTRSTVIYNSKHKSKNYIVINDNLKVTANHSIYTKCKGWIQSSEVTIGDELLKQGEWEIVSSIELHPQGTDTFEVKVDYPNNLFISGYLVHNSPKMGP